MKLALLYYGNGTSLLQKDNQLLKYFTGNKNIKISMFILLFILITTPMASHADKINWMLVDLPPFQYIEDNEYKGYGFNLLRMLQQSLPQYEHQFSQSNAARIMHNIKLGKNTCAFGFFKTKMRDKFVNYSVPDALWFPVQLFMRRDTYLELGRPAELSLSELLEKRQGILGITSEQSYGKSLDDVLQHFSGSKQIQINYSGNITKSLFSMLLINRIDFVIDFPPEGKYTAQLFNAEDKVISVPIKEYRTLTVSHTICPKTPWGEQAIININKALKKLRPKDKWRAAYEQVIDKELIPEYRKNYNRLLLSK